MLSRRANSQFSKPFLRLRQGRLFLVETGPVAEPLDLNARTAPPRRKPPKRVEHFWPCDQCASSWTLAQDANAGIALIPLRQTRVSRKGETAESYREVSRDDSVLLVRLRDGEPLAKNEVHFRPMARM
jgi:hypothetical protein